MDHKIRYTASERISCIESLSRVLSASNEILKDLAKDTSSFYRKKTLPKKTGGNRTVYVPDKALKGIQKKINSRIFGLIKFPDYLQGSISDRDNPRCYIRCATKHCEAVTVSHVDIKDFFDSIEYDYVHKIFSDLLKFPADVSTLLADLCTLNGYIPQGAPTSSYIANLVFYNEEPSIVKSAERMNVIYTRLIDDITISTREKNVSVDRLTKKIKNMITSHDMEINTIKSRTEIRGNKPLTVHGIKVVEKKPKIKREEIRHARAAVHHVTLAAATPGYRATYSYYKMYHSTSGRISKLKRVNHPSYVKLRAKLKPILPLPSKIFKVMLYKKVEKLEQSHPEHCDKDWFRKEWNALYYRLGILGRTYIHESKKLRVRINSVTPKHNE